MIYSTEIAVGSSLLAIFFAALYVSALFKVSEYRQEIKQLTDHSLQLTHVINTLSTKESTTQPKTMFPSTKEEFERQQARRRKGIQS